VLLDGQGADELFGGYPGSNGWALRSEGSTAVLRGLASRDDRRDVLLAIGAERLPVAARRWHRRRLATPYVTAEIRESSVHAPTPIETRNEFGGALSRELLRQAFHTSLPALLRYADRNSMAHSREARLPYLDRRVAEYAWSLPPGFVYRDGVRKAILRDAVRPYVPASVLDRRDKVAFETPQATWLREPKWRDLISNVLLDADARGRGYYDASLIEADARAGRWRDPVGIWRVFNFELWLTTFSPSSR
jgi:asparagine synthase (glutamine-hydrolysing)